MAFYLLGDYGVNPADVLADSLIPCVSLFLFAPTHHSDIDMLAQLKGGDSVLYHALKQNDLSPILCWSAGGYIWGAFSTLLVGGAAAAAAYGIVALLEAKE